MLYVSEQGVQWSNGYLAKPSDINSQTIELLLGPHSVEWPD